jgi:hypothetical protein
MSTTNVCMPAALIMIARDVTASSHTAAQHRARQTWCTNPEALHHSSSFYYSNFCRQRGGYAAELDG